MKWNIHSQCLGTFDLVRKKTQIVDKQLFQFFFLINRYSILEKPLYLTKDTGWQVILVKIDGKIKV
jgi:hypothetical protein